MIKATCALVLKAAGWKFKSELPAELKSFIFLGAPHTSNYDFLPAMAMAFLLRRNARYVIKSDWMKFPLNLLMKPTGAIGVDRDRIKKEGKSSSTDAMARLFETHRELVLMISPEGTRKPNPSWKTGFYYIAVKAKVPIVLAYADYKEKEAGIGAIIYPSDFEKDMRAIMEFYRNVSGKAPENFRLDEKFS